MNQQSRISIVTLGLAVFTMLFGAGNIIYPIKSGAVSGCQNHIGILGFLLTGAVLPILGLVTMILFDGNFKSFFFRLGRVPGFLAILFCMLVVGPFIAMPRCITVPYDMISIFLPTWMTVPLFSIAFCCVTFLLTYRESKFLNILGTYIGPVKIISLLYIALLGLWKAYTGAIPLLCAQPTDSNASIFLGQVLHGFQTLDLLGAICFASIIVSLLKSNAYAATSPKQLALMSLKGGIIGSMLLTIMYVLYSYVGVFYGALLEPHMNGAEIFRVVALDIVGSYGALVIIVSALMACLSTASALSVVCAEYLKSDIFQYKLGYIPCLIIVLVITSGIASCGLSNILYYSMPIINIGYPLIVTITVCNLLYKLVHFTWIKTPVFITALITLWFYCW